jgi:hypothetical protein
MAGMGEKLLNIDDLKWSLKIETEMKNSAFGRKAYQRSRFHSHFE